jgi:hypothetical protein
MIGVFPLRPGAGQLEDLDGREERQYGSGRDQADPHASEREMAADADEEENACEDHRDADVLVPRDPGVFSPRVLDVRLGVENFRFRRLLSA